MCCNRVLALPAVVERASHRVDLPTKHAVLASTAIGMAVVLPPFRMNGLRNYQCALRGARSQEPSKVSVSSGLEGSGIRSPFGYWYYTTQ